MADPSALRLALPELKYPIGSEPFQLLSINKSSTVSYIETVKKLLKPEEFDRIRASFMGPLIKFSERNLHLSAKTVQAVLNRSIKTVKRNEAWFHFGAQPMRFSIREFHMVTGLKCSGEEEEPEESVEDQVYEWDFLEGTHTVDDVKEQLEKTDSESYDERFCLAMLLLIESILLQKNGETNFPPTYAKRAQNINVLMEYPWGRDSYRLLMNSVHNVVKKHLEKNKIELHGYPLALHLWILESVPLLQSELSTVVPVMDVQPSKPIFLCEKYIGLRAPRLREVEMIEAKHHLKVTCILPPIPHDPEDEVSMEDEQSEVLNMMASLSKRGYITKKDDWKNRSINLHDANEEIARRSLLFGNVEMGQTSSKEEFVLSKINSIKQMMEDEFRSINCRLSLVEKENKEMKERLSKLEKGHGVTPDEDFYSETNIDPMDDAASNRNEGDLDNSNERIVNEDDPNTWTDVSPPNLTKRNDTEQMDETGTEPREANIDKASGAVNKETEESIAQTQFEVDEIVEIASGRKWFQANVLKTEIRNGVEMVIVEYSTLFQDKKKRTKRIRETVSSDRIRPVPRTENPEETKSLELMDDVEAYHNDGWYTGKVRAILNDDTYSVSFDRSPNTIQFNLSDLRIPKTWVDGDWKTTKEMEEQQPQSGKPSTQSEKQGEDDRAKKGKAVVGKKRKARAPPVDNLHIEEQQSQSVKPSTQTEKPSEENRARKGKAVVVKKRKAPAPPVDHLAFLQREEKRPIGPVNPPLPETPEVILPIDPFVTPEFPRFSRLQKWMGLRGIHRVPLYINGEEIEKEYFEYIDDNEKNLRDKHINAAFSMLNRKRIEHSTWFLDKSLPKACFVPVEFLETVGYNFEPLKKQPKKGIQIVKGWVREVIRGLVTPNKIWMEDVDVVYGVVHEKLIDHYTGVEIHLVDNTITLFHCGLHQSGTKIENIPLVKKLAVLIPAIKLELMNEWVNFETIVPFKVMKAESIPKTKVHSNCGLFVLKMLECRSMGLKNMLHINDETAIDLRSKLCCDIFDHFMGSDFQ